MHGQADSVTATTQHHVELSPSLKPESASSESRRKPISTQKNLNGGMPPRHWVIWKSGNMQRYYWTVLESSSIVCYCMRRSLQRKGSEARPRNLFENFSGPCIGAFRLLLYGVNQLSRHLPVLYRRPNKQEKWESTVVGLSKRDLLKDVLSIFGACHTPVLHGCECKFLYSPARSKTLAKLGIDWQDVLRRSVIEEW